MTQKKYTFRVRSVQGFAPVPECSQSAARLGKLVLLGIALGSFLAACDFSGNFAIPDVDWTINSATYVIGSKQVDLDVNFNGYLPGSTFADQKLTQSKGILSVLSIPGKVTDAHSDVYAHVFLMLQTPLDPIVDTGIKVTADTSSWVYLEGSRGSLQIRAIAHIHFATPEVPITFIN